MSKLTFISDENLYRHTQAVIDVIKGSLEASEEEFFKNSVDPFSAVFDATSRGITLTEWKEDEKSRQAQKTLQNAIGEFHQGILGSVHGWEDLEKGNVIDLKNDERQIIAEVKNKHNTTKGNHKKAIYDDLAGQLASTYQGYTGYYVEVIPQNKKVYDKPFTPSDNETHARRPENESIRVIDGKSFYALATGEVDALKNLYQALPEVINDILGTAFDFTQDETFLELFERIY